MNDNDRKFVTVPMPSDLYDRLRAYAEADDRTLVSVVRLAVLELLARDDDERKLRMAK